MVEHNHNITMKAAKYPCSMQQSTMHA